MRQKLVIRDDISVELPKGPIGISFSGGADSSLLVYLVLNQIKETWESLSELEQIDIDHFDQTLEVLTHL